MATKRSGVEAACRRFMQKYPTEYGDRRRFGGFLREHPDYLATVPLSRRRVRDFRRLDDDREVYLDFTGAGQYGEPQVRAHAKWLRSATFGNPHSTNPTSLRSTKEVERVREAVLAFFNASPEEYDVVFTSNATGAIKLVGEAYPFDPKRPFCYLIDNHNSVVGVREIAKAKRARVLVPLVVKPNLEIDAADLEKKLTTRHPGLFAYPAQSNFTGVQHSLEWIGKARTLGWTVLLDAAAFVPTNRLDLSRYHPDFVCMSFYKIFGWPTGVGCLIAKKTALAALVRPAFSGGTIDFVSVQGDQYKLTHGASGFEDGTVNFLNLPAVKIGLDYVSKVGIEQIHTRVAHLTDWLLLELGKFKHSNGRPIVEIYGPKTIENRGGTIALNFFTPDGDIIDERLVEQAAARRNISLRTGCFCNPGGGEVAFELERARLQGLKHVTARPYPNLDTLLQFMGISSGGAVRVSLGAVSSFRDVERFLRFVRTFRDAQPDASGMTPRMHC